MVSDSSTGLMARLPQLGGPCAGLAPLLFTALLSIGISFASTQTTSTDFTESERSTEERVPHIRAFRATDDIEGIDGEAGAEWLGLYSHLPLLKLSLPSTYMSTLTDVNVPRYAGKVEAQDRRVADQLRDGIRLLDVRLWRGQKGPGHLTNWFTEVPWRLFDDAEVLLKADFSSLPDERSASALEVHSRTDLAEGLFKPVFQFLRKSLSEVVVVVFSAVNGNVHTSHNMITKGSDLAESLSRVKAQLEAFLHGEGPYSDNEMFGAGISHPERVSTVRVTPQTAQCSPYLDSYVKKNVSFEHFAEITDLVDTYWGQLLPHHMDEFLDTGKTQRRMRDSINDPTAFRKWQTAEGMLLLGKSIAELREANVRLILLVDDPLLAWFITWRSRSRVVAFVKADHLYDVSYKSEARFAPCAVQHTSLHGEPTVSRMSTWPECRDWCRSVGLQKCSSWVWEPDQSSESSGSLPESDLGSWGEPKADEESGQCKLHTSAPAKLSFETITQKADCPHDDLFSSDLSWNASAVLSDLMLSILPTVQVEPRLPGRMQQEPKLAFDPRLCLLRTGYDTFHEARYGISQKLIRVIFAPPTPQVRIEASQRGAHGSSSDAVRDFSFLVPELLLRVFWNSRELEQDGISVRPINAIQVSKYDRIRSSVAPFGNVKFFELFFIVNPPGAVGLHLLTYPGRLFGLMEGASRSLHFSTGSAYVTMWLCLLGVLVAVSLCIFIATFWCGWHPGNLLKKICARRTPPARSPIASLEVVGIPEATSDRVTTA